MCKNFEYTYILLFRTILKLTLLNFQANAFNTNVNRKTKLETPSLNDNGRAVQLVDNPSSVHGASARTYNKGYRIDKGKKIFLNVCLSKNTAVSNIYKRIYESYLTNIAT